MLLQQRRQLLRGVRQQRPVGVGQLPKVLQPASKRGVGNSSSGNTGSVHTPVCSMGGGQQRAQVASSVRGATSVLRHSQPQVQYHSSVPYPASIHGQPHKTHLQNLLGRCLEDGPARRSRQQQRLHASFNLQRRHSGSIVEDGRMRSVRAGGAGWPAGRLAGRLAGLARYAA